jgi:bidirectional [NiFe] hydrogenase diaphorase subunit
MSEVRTLVIDGKDVAAASDQTILSAAAENGVHIPTLCHLDGLSDVAACRLCLVEVAGSPKLLPACTSGVEEGMVVTTTSERLLGYRRRAKNKKKREGKEKIKIKRKEKKNKVNNEKE